MAASLEFLQPDWGDIMEYKARKRIKPSGKLLSLTLSTDPSRPEKSAQDDLLDSYVDESERSESGSAMSTGLFSATESRSTHTSISGATSWATGDDHQHFVLPSGQDEKKFPVDTDDDGDDDIFLDSSANPGSVEHAEDDMSICTQPTRQVDYLSHLWREEDLWASWKHVASHEQAYRHSTRLKNASWRAWAQTRSRLELFPAESLNWRKYCDVTSLYGPLLPGSVDQSGLSFSIPRSNSDVKIGSPTQKLVLRKRRMLEIMLQQSVNSSSLSKKATSAVRAEQWKGIEIPFFMPAAPQDQSPSRASWPYRPSLPGHRHPEEEGNGPIPPSSRLTSALKPTAPGDIRKKQVHFNEHVQQCVALELPSDYESDAFTNDYRHPGEEGNGTISPSPRLTSALKPTAPGNIRKKHVHFNEHVQQCVALELPSDYESDVFTSDHYDDTSDDGGIIIKPSTNRRLPHTSRRKRTDIPLAAEGKTISVLPSTTLNYVDGSSRPPSSIVMPKYLSSISPKPLTPMPNSGSWRRSSADPSSLKHSTRLVLMKTDEEDASDAGNQLPGAPRSRESTLVATKRLEAKKTSSTGQFAGARRIPYRMLKRYEGKWDHDRDGYDDGFTYYSSKTDHNSGKAITETQEVTPPTNQIKENIPENDVVSINMSVNLIPIAANHDDQSLVTLVAPPTIQPGASGITKDKISVNDSADEDEEITDVCSSESDETRSNYGTYRDLCDVVTRDPVSSQAHVSIIQDQMRQRLVDRVMQEFWLIFDREWSNGFKECAGASAYSGSSCSANNQTDSASSSSSYGPHKRLRDDGDGDSPEKCRDNNRGPPPMRHGPTSNSGSHLRFACPFRKHDSQRYSIYSHRVCALSHWETIARIKEHIYRCHQMPIHCKRCWVQFKTQLQLDLHLTVEASDICELKPGSPPEGITPECERLLRSRKKASRNQGDEDRWKDIYKLLFPNEKVPSPYFEPPQENTPMSPESRDLANYEEYARRELPRLVQSSIEEIVRRDLQPLEASLIGSLVGIVQDCQDRLFRSYRQTRAAAGEIESPLVFQSEPIVAPGASTVIINHGLDSQDGHRRSESLDAMFKPVPPVTDTDFPALILEDFRAQNTYLSAPIDMHNSDSGYGSEQLQLCNCPGECSCANAALRHEDYMNDPEACIAGNSTPENANLQWINWSTYALQ